MCSFIVLSKDLLVWIFQYTKDPACVIRLMNVSKWFKSAAESDAIWSGMTLFGPLTSEVTFMGSKKVNNGDVEKSSKLFNVFRFIMESFCIDFHNKPEETMAILYKDVPENASILMAANLFHWCFTARQGLVDIRSQAMKVLQI